MPLKHKCVNMPVVSDYLIHFQLPDLPGKLWGFCWRSSNVCCDKPNSWTAHSRLAHGHILQSGLLVGDSQNPTGGARVVFHEFWCHLFLLASEGRQRALMWWKIYISFSCPIRQQAMVYRAEWRTYFCLFHFWSFLRVWCLILAVGLPASYSWVLPQPILFKKGKM